MKLISKFYKNNSILIKTSQLYQYYIALLKVLNIKCCVFSGADLHVNFPSTSLYQTVSPKKNKDSNINIPSSFPFENLIILLDLLSIVIAKNGEHRSKVNFKPQDLHDLVILFMGIGLDRTLIERIPCDLHKICIGNALELYPEVTFMVCLLYEIGKTF